MGFFGYDIVRQVEHLPDPPEDDLGLPDAPAGLHEGVLAIDTLLGAPWPSIGDGAGGGLPGRTLGPLRHGGAEDAELVDTLASARPPETPAARREPGRTPPVRDPHRGELPGRPWPRPRSIILAGTSSRWSSASGWGWSFALIPSNLYRASVPESSPYLYFLEMDGTPGGASPELWCGGGGGGHVRPIAGTAPGSTPEEDEPCGEAAADERTGGAPDARGLGGMTWVGWPATVHPDPGP